MKLSVFCTNECAMLLSWYKFSVDLLDHSDLLTTETLSTLLIARLRFKNARFVGCGSIATTFLAKFEATRENSPVFAPASNTTPPKFSSSNLGRYSYSRFRRTSLAAI